MISNNLHDLIDIYESKIDIIYNAEHDELFKWAALKCWQDEWYKPEGSFTSFAERFKAARKEFSLFIDNSRMHPSNGLIKLWEKEPETIEGLFDDLLSDTKGDITSVQEHMDSFVGRYEDLRQKYYPGNWSYKQDRHSASVFLAMDKPDFNYVYKSSEAIAMARSIGFGYRIGAGQYFSLHNYYRLCETIVAALKEHEILLEKHFDRLTGKHYVDTSLHMLAFDLMYCCHTYGYYGKIIIPTTESKKKDKASQYIDKKEEEKERNTQILELEKDLKEREAFIDSFESISLVGVKVTLPSKDSRVIIEQEMEKITVQVTEGRKKYTLDEKYKKRPRFENDDSIVAKFTEYRKTKEEIKALQSQIQRLKDRN